MHEFPGAAAVQLSGAIRTILADVRDQNHTAANSIPAAVVAGRAAQPILFPHRIAEKGERIVQTGHTAVLGDIRGPTILQIAGRGLCDAYFRHIRRELSSCTARSAHQHEVHAVHWRTRVRIVKACTGHRLFANALLAGHVLLAICAGDRRCAALLHVLHQKIRMPYQFEAIGNTVSHITVEFVVHVGAVDVICAGRRTDCLCGRRNSAVAVVRTVPWIAIGLAGGDRCVPQIAEILPGRHFLLRHGRIRCAVLCGVDIIFVLLLRGVRGQQAHGGNVEESIGARGARQTIPVESPQRIPQAAARLLQENQTIGNASAPPAAATATSCTRPRPTGTRHRQWYSTARCTTLKSSRIYASILMPLLLKCWHFSAQMKDESMTSNSNPLIHYYT